MGGDGAESGVGRVWAAAGVAGSQDAVGGGGLAVEPVDAGQVDALVRERPVRGIVRGAVLPEAERLVLVAHPNKRRGDRAELEVQALLRDHLGVPARRELGAGRKDDKGDVSGVPGLCVQVVNWKDVAAAVRAKPLEVEAQRLNAGTVFAATFVRLRGGEYRVVLTPEQFFGLYREAIA